MEICNRKMLMINKYKIFCLFLLMLFSFFIQSETDVETLDDSNEYTNNTLLYIGLGSADDKDLVDEDPWAVGFLIRDEKNFYGLDIGGEGIMINQTRDYYGETYTVSSIDQATSFNIMAGMKISGSSKLRADLGLLVGIIEQSSDCPSSYSSYQCYYSSSYENRLGYEYTFNYGVVLHATYERVTLGLRASGESTQLIFGINF